ncbi:MAG: hypothetical protein FJY85_22080, partial [Deltaproteobacteria bacterium]|nr:hypothetical protein [Deltaproteobacteria bacterium]
MEPTRKFTFNEVESLRRQAEERDPFFAGMTTQDFAKYLQSEFQTHAFDAGLAGPVQRGVGWLSDKIGAVFGPAARPAGALGRVTGRGLGGLVSEDWKTRLGNVGEEIGKGFPRLLAEAIALRYGKVGKLLGLGDVALHSYAGTGSVPKTAVHTATFAAMPRLGRWGEQMVKGGVKKVASGAAQRAIEEAGRTATQVAGLEASRLLTGGKLSETFSLENVAGTIGGVLPWTVLRTPEILRGYYMKDGRVRPVSWKELLSTKPLPGSPVRSAYEAREITKALSSAIKIEMQN